MPVPKRKVSRSRRDKRKAHWGLNTQVIFYCNSGICKNEPKLPHEVCLNCGFYKGKKVIRTKMDRELRRREAMGKKTSTKIQQQPEAPLSEPHEEKKD